MRNAKCCIKGNVIHNKDDEKIWDRKKYQSTKTTTNTVTTAHIIRRTTVGIILDRGHRHNIVMLSNTLCMCLVRTCLTALLKKKNLGIKLAKLHFKVAYASNSFGPWFGNVHMVRFFLLFASHIFLFFVGFCLSFSFACLSSSYSIKTAIRTAASTLSGHTGIQKYKRKRNDGKNVKRIRMYYVIVVTALDNIRSNDTNDGLLIPALPQMIWMRGKWERFRGRHRRFPVSILRWIYIIFEVFVGRRVFIFDYCSTFNRYKGLLLNVIITLDLLNFHCHPFEFIVWAIWSHNNVTENHKSNIRIDNVFISVVTFA